MPKPARVVNGVDSDTLRKLQRRGVDSELLQARLDFAEPDQLLKHFINPLLGVDRIYPYMLPTQASLRWSTTNPPLVNFPPDCLNPEHSGREPHMARGEGCFSARDIVLPDEGEWWLCFDFDAVEARIAAAYSGDPDDLASFNQNWDVHTVTACRMFGLALPPDLQNPHTSDAVGAKEWRAQVEWQGKEDRRRHLAKTMRYALQYGTDEMAVLQARDVEKLGLTRDELLRFARMYLASKPRLAAAKRKAWDEVRDTGMSRTFLGHRRMLFMSDTDYLAYKGLRREHGELVRCRPRPCEAQRQGWNHKIQGAVAAIMDLTLLRLRDEVGARLVLNKHDGAELAFSAVESVRATLGAARELVEGQWDIAGNTVHLTAEWEAVYSDGRKEALK